jgi:hypothetical protein
VPLPAPNESDEGELARILHRATAGCIPDVLVEEIFTPSFAASIRGRARESLARYFAEEEGNWLGRVKQFRLRHAMARMVWPSVQLYADDLAPRDPFKDAELVEFCRRIPDHLRLNGNLECAYLRQFASVSRLRSPKDGLPPALAGRRRVLAARVVKTRRRARRFEPRRLQRRRGIGDYASDLEVGGRELLGILTEPRTLERGQLREDAVRRLVHETLGGTSRSTRIIGTLLTFEMFQRQFLEGEAPAGLGSRESSLGPATATPDSTAISV